MTQAAGTLRGHGTGTVYTPEGGRRSALLVAKSLFVLTKPRIIELLLVTTLPTMLLAQRGLPPAWLMAATLTGGALAAASANTLNCFIDRDIDAVMRRTSRRPLAATGAKKVIRPGEALVSGIVLGAASTVLLALLVNGGDARARPVRGLAVRLLRGRARRVVPGRGAPAAGAGRRRRCPGPDVRLFHRSIGYLTLLFAAVAVAALLPWGRW